MLLNDESVNPVFSTTDKATPEKLLDVLTFLYNKYGRREIEEDVFDVTLNLLLRLLNDQQIFIRPVYENGMFTIAILEEISKPLNQQGRKEE